MRSLIVIVIASLFLTARVLAASSSQDSPRNNTEDVDSLALVTVVGVTPLAGTDIPTQKLPYYTQSANDDSLRRSQALDVTDFMSSHLAGVALNQSQGNPLQPDLQFRGYTATPLLGGSEGVSVYVDGVRVNEVFGDTVNWDLIPEAAIERLSLLSGANPIFGLNTLGGAVSIQTKTGFSDPGTRAEYYDGSFGRSEGTAETGGHAGTWGWYVMGTYFDEKGWRDFSPSRAANLYGTLSWRGSQASLDLHAGRGNTNLVGNGAAPVEELARRYESIFTAPDQTGNTLTVLSLQGSLDVAPARKLSFNAYHRAVNTQSLNADATDAQPCDDDANILCDEAGTPERDQNGQPLPVSLDAINNLSGRHQRADGGTLQMTLKDPVAGLDNLLVLGADYVRGRVGFDTEAQASTLGPHLQVAQNTGILIPDASLRVESGTSATGLFFTDTLTAIPGLAVTVSGRWNRTRVTIGDVLGSHPDLNGGHTYARFNPAAGVTYQIAPALNVYAGYSESTRAPTPVELTCASENAPCKLPNQFLADPSLREVVAGSWEVGVRGVLNTGEGTSGSGMPLSVPPARVTWHAGLFRTTNEDDILFQTTGGASSNEGFFANVGGTRRQGAELTVEMTSADDRLHAYANYTFLDATYRSGFVEASANHPDADDDGNITVPTGARIPSLPRHNFKLGMDSTFWRRLSIGGDLVSSSGQYLRGDEANLLGQVPGYTVVNLRAAVAITDHLSVYGHVDNVFDRHYYTFGILGRPGEVFADFSDPRFLSPAQTRGAWVGVRLVL